jgi:hypothetical protein
MRVCVCMYVYVCVCVCVCVLVYVCLCLCMQGIVLFLFENFPITFFYLVTFYRVMHRHKKNKENSSEKNLFKPKQVRALN